MRVIWLGIIMGCLWQGAPAEADILVLTPSASAVVLDAEGNPVVLIGFNWDELPPAGTYDVDSAHLEWRATGSKHAGLICELEMLAIAPTVIGGRVSRDHEVASVASRWEEEVDTFSETNGELRLRLFSASMTRLKSEERNAWFAIYIKGITQASLEQPGLARLVVRYARVP